MFRLLNFVGLAALFVLVVLGAPHHQAHHPSRVEQLDAPAAVSIPSGHESLPDLNSLLPSTIPSAPTIHVTHFSAAWTNALAPRDPLATFSVLRI